MLKDKINFYGEFSIKQLDKNGNVLSIYEDKNLIVDTGRSNMAEIIGGVTATGDIIDSFVIGTFGHMGSDILDPQAVDEQDTDKTALGVDTFDVDMVSLFSEVLAASAFSTSENYKIEFDVTGTADETDATATGTPYIVGVAGTPDASANTVRRVVADKTVTYTITIPITNGNAVVPTTPIAYTEAGLYAGTDLFAMKTFPARVKESTTQLIITWSIIF